MAPVERGHGRAAGREVLGIAHVPYTLLRRVSKHTDAAMTASVCPLFTDAKVGFVPARSWLGKSDGGYNDLLSAYETIGSEKAFRAMVVLDVLTLNPGRHMGNHGILFDNDTLEPISMAPVFDNNLSLCPAHTISDSGILLNHVRRTLRPSIGGDFLSVAHAAMDEDMKERVAALSEFAFNPTLLPGFPEERLAVLEEVVHTQAEMLVTCDDPRFNLTNERSLEYAWTFDGWPDDEVDLQPDVYPSQGSEDDVVI